MEGKGKERKGREESMIGQGGELDCNAFWRKDSASLTGSSEAGLALQSFPKLRWEAGVEPLYYINQSWMWAF